ncbi:MAG: hypothetical protein K2I64_07220 [Muribaculaceae bacterium]|nr:hypothetical protein [Muribaculaceae bacterium]
MNIHNLRFNSEEGAYRTVGAPAVVSERCWCGVAYLPGGNGMATEFVADGNRLGVAVYSMRERPSDPVEIGELSFVPESAVEVEGGFLIIGEGRKAMVTTDEGGLMRISDPDREFPEVVVETRSAATISKALPAVKLTDIYDSHSTVLSATDSDKLSEMLYKAYGEAVSEAGASGLFVQGVMSRTVMRDSAGNVLFRSSPVWHTCLSGNPVPDSVHINIPGGSGVTDRSSLALEAFRLYLRLPACQPGNELYGRVARLEVELSPQIHLPEPDMTAVARIIATPGTPLQIEAGLPGCSLPDESYRLKMIKAVEADDRLFSVACTIPYPFKERQSEELVPVFPRRLSLDEERDCLDRYGGKGSRSDAILSARFAPPHTVAPRTLHTGTGATLIGDPSVSLFSGHSLDYFAHKRGAVDTVETVVAVELEGGRRRVVRHCITPGGRFPESVSPLFTYPDPSATSATFMAVGSDGKCRKLTVTLTPAAGFAYWLSDTLRPVALPAAVAQEEFYIPEPVNTVADYPGYLVSARSGYPFEALSAIHMDGNICSIHAAPRPASSSWESGSPRYVVAGTGGIWSVGLNSAGRIGRPVLLDSRPVAGRRAVTPGTGISGESSLYIIAGKDIVAVSSNRVKTLKRGVEATMTAWSAAHAELCLVTPGSDTAEVYSPETGLWSTRTLHSVTDVMSTGSAFRLTSSADGYLDLNTELHTSVHCSLADELRLPAGRHPFRPATPVAEVLADLTSSSADATLDILGSGGSTSYIPLSRVAFSGRINAPVAHRLIIPHRYKLRYLLDGLFSHDTRIYSVK